MHFYIHIYIIYLFIYFIGVPYLWVIGGRGSTLNQNLTFNEIWISKIDAATGQIGLFYSLTDPDPTHRSAVPSLWHLHKIPWSPRTGFVAILQQGMDMAICFFFFLG